MREPATADTSAAGASRRDVCGGLALGLALALVAATFFLISPPPGETYPGAIPWREGSLLRRLIEALSLGGWLVSVRGAEIKDFALHLAATAGLFLAAVSLGQRGAGVTPAPQGPVRHARVLLGLWVGLSLLSTVWAGDVDLARGQALLYAFSLAWAVTLSVTLPARLVPPLLHAMMVLSALAGALCVWYFHERNPYHRPGFPLGNPNTLAVAVVPGLLIAIGALAEALAPGPGRPRRRLNAAVILAMLSLPPLVWCLGLTYSRGALLGLGAGLAALGVYLVPRRWRWGLAGVLAAGVLSAGAWWFSTSHLDLTMARGATMRFRLYAWRYAAELWNADPWTRVAGQGAGAYPRLAGAYAAHDRALDPAAFMGEIVEHAHNELFEILAEIGLVGGVTWVGGMIATLAAAVLALRTRRALPVSAAPPVSTPSLIGPSPWLLRGLLAAVVAILADSAFSSALRLPGVGAIFFTLIGALWAMCQRANEPNAPPAPAPPGRAATWTVAVICLLAGTGAGGLALRNWLGVQNEYAAHAAFGRADYDTVLHQAARAEQRLLDPVRVIVVRKLQLQSVFAMARDAVQTWYTTTDSPPEAWGAAAARATVAYETALRLRNSVPSLEHTDATAARAAEWMAHLSADTNAPAAGAWAEQAWQAWRRQRQRTPYDVETLLALTRYPAPLADHVALLRDALRFGDTYGAWRARLEQLAGAPLFAETLVDFLIAAGPITPQTDVDAIVASMAPEACRLAAAWHGLRGEFAQAAALAARAARLYEPLRPRFPALQAAALSEQADYVLRADEEGAAEAAALLRQAIATLPIIQRQQYDEMARPLRIRLALCLLVGEHVEEGLAMLGLALGEAVADPDDLEAVVHRLLHDAAAAGVPAERLDRARRALCPRYPAFCDDDGG